MTFEESRRAETLERPDHSRGGKGEEGRGKKERAEKKKSSLDVSDSAVLAKRTKFRERKADCIF